MKATSIDPEKFVGIHGLIIVADGKVQVIPHFAFQQGGVAIDLHYIIEKQRREQEMAE